MPRLSFLLGAPRSGSTLLRAMLAGHPELFAPPELRLAPFATMVDRAALVRAHPWEGEGLTRALMALLSTDRDAAIAAEAGFAGQATADVYAWILERAGGRQLIDKDPRASHDAAALDRLRAGWPDAVFLRIVRHPVSTIRSMRAARRTELLYADVPHGAYWAESQRVQTAFLATLPPDRTLTVRFEDLVRDPAPVLAAVCGALGVPFVDAVLDPYAGERWIDGPPGARALGDTRIRARRAIDPAAAESWRAGIEPLALTPALRAVADGLGYDLSDVPIPRAARASAALAAALLAAPSLGAARAALAAPGHTAAPASAPAAAPLFADLADRALLIADADDDGRGIAWLAATALAGIAAATDLAAVARARPAVLRAIDRPLDAWRRRRGCHERFAPADGRFPTPGGRAYAAFWRFDDDERWVVRYDGPGEVTFATFDRWMQPIAAVRSRAVALSRAASADPAWLDPGREPAGWLVMRGPADATSPTITVERVR